MSDKANRMMSCRNIRPVQNATLSRIRIAMRIKKKGPFRISLRGPVDQIKVPQLLVETLAEVQPNIKRDQPQSFHKMLSTLVDHPHFHVPAPRGLWVVKKCLQSSKLSISFQNTKHSRLPILWNSGFLGYLSSHGNCKGAPPSFLPPRKLGPTAGHWVI